MAWGKNGNSSSEDHLQKTWEPWTRSVAHQQNSQKHRCISRKTLFCFSSRSIKGIMENTLSWSGAQTFPRLRFIADPDVPSRKSYSLIHSSISMLFHLWYMLQLASPSNSTWATIRKHRRFSRDSTCTLSVNFDERDDFWYEGLTSPGYDFRKWKDLDLSKVIISEVFFRSLKPLAATNRARSQGCFCRSKSIFFFNLPFNTVHNVHRQPLYKPQI